MNFNKDILKINCGSETKRICSFIEQQMRLMYRNGIIIGISGGIDSALSSALSVRAIGKDKVLGLILPDKESSPLSEEYAMKQAKKLGIRTEKVDITSILEAFGTYEKRDAVAKEVFPELGANFKLKITLPSELLTKDALNFFTLTVVDEKNNTKSTRLKNEQAKGIIAATCTKHRTRMLIQYYYAEKNNYLVCGTTNKSEALQGLFVKYGDGGVDIEPLQHLYKNQIYQLAEYLGVIKEIRQRAPCPDTYSAPVTDEEWYLRIPFKQLDLLLYAWTNKVAISKICKAMGLNEEQVKRAFRDFNSKANATKHLNQLPPTLDN
ncbi:MAG: NAD(+) synthase [Actinomycetota bacterium]